MYNFFLHFHSILRWALLIVLIITLVKYAQGFRKQQFSEGDRKLALYTLIFSHLQLVLGFALYFISPKVQFTADMMKVTTLRFYAVEHLVGMLIAIGLITIGYSKMKRTSEAAKKYKKTFYWFLAAFIIIMASIPWPFRIPGAGWL